jgi:hypothetical protein
MTIGLVLFTLIDSKMQPNFDVYGVIFICLTLIIDAFISNLQEKMLKQTDSSNKEMIFFMYLFGFIMLLLWNLLVEKNLKPAFLLYYEVIFTIAHFSKHLFLMIKA